KTKRDIKYLCETDDILVRLKQHNKDEKKDFWTRAIAVTSKDQNLTKAHGCYLESRFIELANAAKRARLENGCEPAPKSLPESDRADMEYFLAQVQLMLPVLGFDFLRPQATVLRQSHAQGSPRFLMKDVGAEATAYEIDGEFVVLKGSTARRVGAASWDCYIPLRDSLVKEGKLATTTD